MKTPSPTTIALVLGGSAVAVAAGVVVMRSRGSISTTAPASSPAPLPAPIPPEKVRGKCGVRDYCRAKPWNCVGNAAAAVGLAAASGVTGGAASPASLAHGAAFGIRVRNWCKEQKK